MRRIWRDRVGGFTLLELLVVIVIIGLLSAFVAPKYFGQIGRSKAQIAKAQIESFSKAIDQYQLDTGRFPSKADGLAALVARNGTDPNWHGPYLKKGVPLDPWGNAYVYNVPEKGGDREYEIISYGSDGKALGEGDAADIVSW